MYFLSMTALVRPAFRMPSHVMHSCGCEIGPFELVLIGCRSFEQKAVIEENTYTKSLFWGHSSTDECNQSNQLAMARLAYLKVERMGIL